MNGSKVKVKLNSAGIKEVLKSDFMMDALKAEGTKHGEFETSFVGFDRCHVIVYKGEEDADRTDSQGLS